MSLARALLAALTFPAASPNHLRRMRSWRALLFAAVFSTACSSHGDPAATTTTPPPPPRPLPAGLTTDGVDDPGKRQLGDLFASEPSPCKVGQSLYDAYADPSCRRAK